MKLNAILRRLSCVTLMVVTSWLGCVQAQHKVTAHFLFAPDYDMSKEQLQAYTPLITGPSAQVNFTKSESLALDRFRLETRYKELLQSLDVSQLKTHKDGIVILGVGRGATAALTATATSRLAFLKALVVESPVDPLAQALIDYGQELFDKSQGKLEEIQPLFTRALPDPAAWYVARAQVQPLRNVYSIGSIDRIDRTLPLLLIVQHNDPFYSNNTTRLLYIKLKQAGYTNVYLLDLEDILGAGTVTSPYVAAVHAFYKKYDIPYDTTLAAEGQQYFAQAQPSIESVEQSILSSYEDNAFARKLGLGIFAGGGALIAALGLKEITAPQRAAAAQRRELAPQRQELAKEVLKRVEEALGEEVPAAAEIPQVPQVPAEGRGIPKVPPLPKAPPRAPEGTSWSDVFKSTYASIVANLKKIGPATGAGVDLSEPTLLFGGLLPLTDIPVQLVPPSTTAIPLEPDLQRRVLTSQLLAIAFNIRELQRQLQVPNPAPEWLTSIRELLLLTTQQIENLPQPFRGLIEGRALELPSIPPGASQALAAPQRQNLQNIGQQLIKVGEDLAKLEKEAAQQPQQEILSQLKTIRDNVRWLQKQLLVPNPTGELLDSIKQLLALTTGQIANLPQQIRKLIEGGAPGSSNLGQQIAKIREDLAKLEKEVAQQQLPAPVPPQPLPPAPKLVKGTQVPEQVYGNILSTARDIRAIVNVDLRTLERLPLSNLERIRAYKGINQKNMKEVEGKLTLNSPLMKELTELSNDLDKIEQRLVEKKAIVAKAQEEARLRKQAEEQEAERKQQQIQQEAAVSKLLEDIAKSVSDQQRVLLEVLPLNELEMAIRQNNQHTLGGQQRLAQRAIAEFDPDANALADRANKLMSQLTAPEQQPLHDALDAASKSLEEIRFEFQIRLQRIQEGINKVRESTAGPLPSATQPTLTPPLPKGAPEELVRLQIQLNSYVRDAQTLDQWFQQVITELTALQRVVNSNLPVDSQIRKYAQYRINCWIHIWPRQERPALEGYLTRLYAEAKDLDSRLVKFRTSTLPKTVELAAGPKTVEFLVSPEYIHYTQQLSTQLARQVKNISDHYEQLTALVGPLSLGSIPQPVLLSEDQQLKQYTALVNKLKSNMNALAGNISRYIEAAQRYQQARVTNLAEAARLQEFWQSQGQKQAQDAFNADSALADQGAQDIRKFMETLSQSSPLRERAANLLEELNQMRKDLEGAYSNLTKLVPGNLEQSWVMLGSGEEPQAE